jgi:hypothetical protein
MSETKDPIGTPRRDFLRRAGATAAALVASSPLFGQSAAQKSAVHKMPARKEAGDRGMWITWYDLPGDGRDAYLDWLHGTYLPSLLKRPGYLWAAHYATRDTEDNPQLHHTDDVTVPTGFRYILLIGADDAFVFGNPVPAQLNAALADRGKKMLALRRGVRENIAAEAGHLDGKAMSGYKDGLMSAPYIQIGSYNCPVEYEEELHGGYVQARIPAMCATESCVRTRKLNSVSGWAKHIILYEFTDEAGYRRDYFDAGKRTPIGLNGHSVIPLLIHAPHGPNSCVRIWPAGKT